jgi:glycosyltransferase involved in cell wall biosynthesis
VAHDHLHAPCLGRPLRAFKQFRRSPSRAVPLRCGLTRGLHFYAPPRGGIVEGRPCPPYDGNVSVELPVVLLITYRFDRRGGTEAHAIDSYRLLRDAGYPVSVAVGADPVDAKPGDVIHVVPDLKLGPLTASTRRAVAKIVDQVQPDIVHVHNLNAPESLLDLVQHCAVVWSVHSLIGCAGRYKSFPGGRECHRAHGAGCLAHMVVNNCGHRRIPFPNVAAYTDVTQMIIGMKRVDACVVYSQYMVRHHANNGLSNTVAAPLFPSAPTIDSRGRSTEGRVLFAGRITPQKGLEFLIRAIARTRLSLDVAGDGWGQPAAERLASRLGVSDRVNFLGWQSSEGLEEAYGRATVVAVPSMLPEPVGLAGLEALARGKAVVATNWGGIPEWCRHEKTGLLVEPGDVDGLAAALCRLGEHPDEAHALGRAGKGLIHSDYSPARYMEVIERIYDRALQVAADRRKRLSRSRTIEVVP